MHRKELSITTSSASRPPFVSSASADAVSEHKTFVFFKKDLPPLALSKENPKLLQEIRTEFEAWVGINAAKFPFDIYKAPVYQAVFMCKDGVAEYIGNSIDSGSTQVRIEFEIHPTTLTIQIEDNGKGIPKEKLLPTQPYTKYLDILKESLAKQAAERKALEAAAAKTKAEREADAKAQALKEAAARAALGIEASPDTAASVTADVGDSFAAVESKALEEAADAQVLRETAARAALDIEASPDMTANVTADSGAGLEEKNEDVNEAFVDEYETHAVGYCAGHGLGMHVGIQSDKVQGEAHGGKGLCFALVAQRLERLGGTVLMGNNPSTNGAIIRIEGPFLPVDVEHKEKPLRRRFFGLEIEHKKESPSFVFNQRQRSGEDSPGASPLSANGRVKRGPHLLINTSVQKGPDNMSELALIPEEKASMNASSTVTSGLKGSSCLARPSSARSASRSYGLFVENREISLQRLEKTDSKKSLQRSNSFS